MMDLNQGLGTKSVLNAEKYGSSPDGQQGDGFTIGSNDIPLITRSDPSSYHSNFGEHSFKKVSDG